MEYRSCQINLISFFQMTTLVDKCRWNRVCKALDVGLCDIVYRKTKHWHG